MPQAGSEAAPGAAAPRIECVGVQALDLRRVDVAVDLGACVEPITLELVIVGPGDEELCSMLVVHTREPALDKVMHLRSDAEPGEHILHVGLFRDEELLDHAVRRFSFPTAGMRRGG